MDKKSDSYAKAQPFIEALRQLARDGHLSSRLHTSRLLELPIVTDKFDPAAPAELKADGFIKALALVIDKRLTGSDQIKGQALFSYGPYAGKAMSERYDAAAKAYNPRATWNSFRKEPLEEFLMTVLTALHREAAARRVTGTDPAPSAKGRPTTSGPSRPALIGGDFELAQYEVQYNMPRVAGEPRETMEVREIRATSDGLDHWRLGSRYIGMSKNPDEAPSVSLFGPGSLEVVRDERLSQPDTPGRAHIMRVTFPRPLTRGETIRFGLVRRQHVDFEAFVRSGKRDQRDVTPVVPIDRAEIGVRFPDKHRPDAVWHFEDLPEYLAPGAPDETNRLQPDESGYVSFVWHDLLVGHSYGIAWRW